MEAAFVREARYLDDAEREGGRCPICAAPARLMTCWACCESAWVIACEHRPPPAPMKTKLACTFQCSPVFSFLTSTLQESPARCRSRTRLKK